MVRNVSPLHMEMGQRRQMHFLLLLPKSLKIIQIHVIFSLKKKLQGMDLQEFNFWYRQSSLTLETGHVSYRTIVMTSYRIFIKRMKTHHGTCTDMHMAPQGISGSHNIWKYKLYQVPIGTLQKPVKLSYYENYENMIIFSSEIGYSSGTIPKKFTCLKKKTYAKMLQWMKRLHWEMFTLSSLENPYRASSTTRTSTEAKDETSLSVQGFGKAHCF